MDTTGTTTNTTGHAYTHEGTQARLSRFLLDLLFPRRPPSTSRLSNRRLLDKRCFSFVQGWKYLRKHTGFRREPVKTLYRLALWRIFSLTTRGVRLSLDSLETRMYLPSQWRGSAKLIFAFSGCYEAELLLLKNWLRPGMTVVDAGACYGLYTVMAARRVGLAGLVIAFEPALETYQVLLKNVRLNKLQNVIPVRCALGSHTGRALLRHYADPSRSSLGLDSGCLRSEPVDVVPLDEALDQLGIRRLDVIKVDVEGAETLVLEGAWASVQRFRPLMLIEVHTHSSRLIGRDSAALLRMFSELGYAAFQVSGSTGRLESVHRAAQLEHCHIVVAAPSDEARRLFEQSPQ